MQQTPSHVRPGAPGGPQAHFERGAFHDLIASKGNPVMIEKAIHCPCRVRGGDRPLSTCRNCGGSGWAYLQGVSTDAVVQSMGYQQKYTNWTEASSGTVSITTTEQFKLGLMDRVTLLKGMSVFSQVLHPVVWGDTSFAYLVYTPVEVEFVFMFEGDDQKLKLLAPGVDYNLEGNRLELVLPFMYGQDMCVSIRYRHHPAFHVLDIPRDVMDSRIITPKGPSVEPMPLHAIARRCHYQIKGDFTLTDRFAQTLPEAEPA